MTVEDIRTRKEGQTFDRKSIRTETEQKQDGNRTETGIRLTEIRVSILQLKKDNSNITKADLAGILNVHPSAISLFGI